MFVAPLSLRALFAAFCLLVIAALGASQIPSAVHTGSPTEQLLHPTPLAFGLEFEGKIHVSKLQNRSIAAAAQLFSAFGATPWGRHHLRNNTGWAVEYDGSPSHMMCAHQDWMPLEIISPKLQDPRWPHCTHLGTR